MLGIIDVRGPVERDEEVGACLDPERDQRPGVRGLLTKAEQRVDHRVADQVDLLRRVALSAQVLIRVGRGA